jgi:non-specific serine/threonine protein kinase
MDSEAACSTNCLPAGVQIGEYRVLDVIGEGGFGRVYKARDLSLDREVAIKEYMPSALAGRQSSHQVHVRSQHRGAFDAGLRSFINEARLLARFSHPTLVHVYRFFEAGGTAYMVMRHYEGQTLGRVLEASSGRIGQAQLCALVAPLLDVLEVLHAEDCFHRDIAPDNIFVQRDGSPVLLDFGAARRIIGDMTQALTMVLKPGFAPIEQYVDDGAMPQGAWTDIYQVGALIHQAATGRTPATSVARMVTDPMQPLTSEQVPGYSDAFLQGMQRALAVRPQDRPQSIAELRSLLGLSSDIGAVPALAESSPIYIPITTPAAVQATMALQPAAVRAPGFLPITETFVPATAPQAAPMAAPAPTATAPVPVAPSASAQPAAAVAVPLVAPQTAPQSSAADPMGLGNGPYIDIDQALPAVSASQAQDSGPAPAPEQPAATPAVQGRPPAVQTPATGAQAAPKARRSVLVVPMLIGTLVLAAIVGGGVLWYDHSQDQARAKTLAARDSLAWQQAQSQSSLARLQDYLDSFPEGQHRTEAQALLKQLLNEASLASTEQVQPMSSPEQQAALPEMAPSQPEQSTPVAPVTVATGSEPLPTEPPRTEARPAKPAAATGKVVFRIVPWGYVSVNRAAARTSPPLTQMELPEGEYRIDISNPGAASTVTKTITVTKGESVTVNHLFE